jgi:hypothetical protein
MKKPDYGSAAAWKRHSRSQLDYFRSLSLRERMEAVEGMADVVRHFRRMRAQGAFHTSSQVPAKPKSRLLRLLRRIASRRRPPEWGP